VTAALLLVSGSRSLDPRHAPAPGTPASERWARGVLCEAIAALPSGIAPPSCVVHGGARGPDAWAGESAKAHGLTVVEYRLDGKRYVNGQYADERWTDSLTGWKVPTLLYLCLCTEDEPDVEALRERHGPGRVAVRRVWLPALDTRTLVERFTGARAPLASDPAAWAPAPTDACRSADGRCNTLCRLNGVPLDAILWHVGDAEHSAGIRDAEDFRRARAAWDRARASEGQAGHPLGVTAADLKARVARERARG